MNQVTSQEEEIRSFVKQLPSDIVARDKKIRLGCEEVESRLMRMSMGNLELKAQIIDAIALRKAAGC